MPMKDSFFTQTVCFLLNREIPLEEIEQALSRYTILQRTAPTKSWMLSGPGIAIAYRPEVHGSVLIDIVNRPWPDTMGDGKPNTELFNAWYTGQFGPFVYPNHLKAAVEHCWWGDKQRLSAAAHQHTAFLRIRTSYLPGAQKCDPLIPADYHPLQELLFVLQIAASLSTLPGILCYFNPNSQTLLESSVVEQIWERYAGGDTLPIELWTNRRLFRFTDEAEWVVMDILGMEQLHVMDIEMCFTRNNFDTNQMAHYLMNAALYLLQNGSAIKDGETALGPGGFKWRAHRFDTSLGQPQRPVLRFVPLDGHTVPPPLLTREQGMIS